MKRPIALFFCLHLFLSASLGAQNRPDYDKYWPQWRGPLATGVAPHANPPIEWSENQNIRWKIKIPGKGNASPIVWENKVLILTAIEIDKPVSKEEEKDEGDELFFGVPLDEAVDIIRGTGNRSRGGGGESAGDPVKFTALAINRSDGKIIWQSTVREAVPHGYPSRDDSTLASNSAVTDGTHIFAYFGSNGLYCLDMDGNLKWEEDFGDMQTRNNFGEGSSPSLYGDTIVINWDHEGQSFIVALDKTNGQELWRVDRDERTSWSTPIVVEQNNIGQIITSATNRVRSYDISSGSIIWEMDGLTANVIPSPVFGNGLLYVMSGFRGNALKAIRLEGSKDDITGSDAIVWSYDGRNTPYTPSPLLYQGNLYFLKSNDGILSCFNAETGQTYYGPERLPSISGVYASPVGANGRVYIAGRNGAVLVLKHGIEFGVLAENSLDDGFQASPAIVDNEIYLKGYQNLYCIAAD